MTEEVKKKMTKKEIKKEILSYVFIIVGVFAFRSSFFEPNHIPSGSLLPTNSIGDFILVNKFSYGFKIPYTDMFMDEPVNLNPSEPERGDIVVFKYPKDESILYVKRVIGLPGDEIQVLENEVYLNGKVVSTEPVGQEKRKELLELFGSKYQKDKISFRKNSFGEKSFYTAVDASAPAYLFNSRKVTVPKGQYFMMGDNRNHSSDSRFWGFVPFKLIQGRAVFVWFNMVYPWSEEEFNFRPWRIGTLL